MDKNNLRLAVIQLAVSDEDKQTNLDHAAEKIREVNDVDLILLPGFWNIGLMNFDRYQHEAEDQAGVTLELLRSLAIEGDSYIHTGNLVERDGSHLYNASYLLSPGGEILALYRKMHLANLRARETRLLKPDENFEVVKTPLGTIGMATGQDLRHPDMFRKMAAAGADIFLVSAAWPYPKLEHWLMLNRLRASENQVILVSANAAGKNQDSTYVGHSMVVNPWGVIEASAGDQETTLVLELDFEVVSEAREEYQALADRKGWLKFDLVNDNNEADQPRCCRTVGMR